MIKYLTGVGRALVSPHLYPVDTGAACRGHGGLNCSRWQTVIGLPYGSRRLNRLLGGGGPGRLGRRISRPGTLAGSRWCR
jgi:hypothetical protein